MREIKWTRLHKVLEEYGNRCIQLAKEKIIKDNDIKTEPSDVQELATQVAQSQFAQYGMSNLPVDMLKDYVKRMLENEETVNGLFARVVENKIAAWLKENITLDIKEITSEEFSKITAEENQTVENDNDDTDATEDDDVQEVDVEEEKETKEGPLQK